jgi:hypothetical protein
VQFQMGELYRVVHGLDGKCLAHGANPKQISRDLIDLTDVDGKQEVASAGSTMNEIVASVQRVSEVIGEITAAATEQSAGIGQINRSVFELDTMTQQNAARVEQSAAAAESLRGQATRLASVVGRFELAPADAEGRGA